MRVNVNKTKVMISEEWQKAVKWPCGVCGRGVDNNSIQCTSCQKWVHRKCSGIMMRGPRTLNILQESRRSRMEGGELG